MEQWSGLVWFVDGGWELVEYCYIGGTTRPVIALKLLPPEAGQAGEEDPWGRRTGAKALFCLAEDGKEENGRREDEELEPGMVGLDGIMP